MSVYEIQAAIDGWDRAGLPCGVATLVRVRRTAPRRPGARFAVCASGETAGSISSGCVEGDLAEHIMQVVGSRETRLVSYGITDEMAVEVGLACGGEIEVLIQPHETQDPVWSALCESIVEARAAVLVTGLSEEVRGGRLLVRDDGTRLGGLGDEALDEELRRTVRGLLDTGGSRIVTLRGDTLEFFAEAFLPPRRLAIVGATPVAEALSHLAAYLGFSVTVIDPREGIGREERFPDATVIRAWPEDGLPAAGLDRYLSVAAIAHDPKVDLPALAAALRAGCRYVGLLGGRRTQRLRREALLEMGLSEEQVARVRGPIGLDIGAVEPREIALAIAAELLSLHSPGVPET